MTGLVRAGFYRGLAVGLTGGFVGAVLVWVGLFGFGTEPSDPPLTKSDPGAIVAKERSGRLSPPTSTAPQALGRAPEVARAEIPAFETIDDIMLMSSDFDQTAYLYLRALRADEPALLELLAQASTLESERDLRAARIILYQRYGQLNPIAAVDHIMAADSLIPEEYMRHVFEAWARVDFDGAVAHVTTLPGRYRRTIASAVLMTSEGLSATEFKRLATELSVQGLSERLQRQKRMADAAKDPLSAWEAALRENNGVGGNANQKDLQAIASAWARRDPIAALDTIEITTEGSRRSMLRRQVVQRWAQSDPAAALDWVVTHVSEEDRTELMQPVLTALARDDVSAALSYAESLNGRGKTVALQGVLQTWVQFDPDAAVRWLQTSDSDAVTTSSASVIASVLAQSDADAALAWVGSLSDEHARAAVGIVISTMAKNDPAGAARHLQTLDEDLQNASARQLIMNWGHSDPRAAADWLASFDRGDTRKLKRTLVQTWARSDPEAARRYVNRIGDAQERDQVAISMMSSRYRDVEFMEQVYESITTPATKKSAAQILSQILRRTDPVAAERYRKLGEL